jgi:hypothetical protein
LALVSSAPLPGKLTEELGAVLSRLILTSLKVVTPKLVSRLPALSLAREWIVYLPSGGLAKL